MLISLLTPAFAALDCPSETTLDPEICAAANQVEDLVNAHVGYPVITANNPNARLRTIKVYNRLAAVAASFGANPSDDCSADSVWGGDWRIGSQEAGGRYETLSGGDSGFATGVFKAALRVAGGDYLGSDGHGQLGNAWGESLPGGKFAINRDVSSEFVAGGWIRVQGKYGVWVGYSGACTVDARGPLEAWYGREIQAVGFDEVHPLLVNNCGSCHFDGGEPPYIGAADIAVAYAETQTTCLPAANCGEESVSLIVGETKPPSGPLSVPVQLLFQQWENNGYQDVN